jgi:hypothetical protein
MRRFFKFLLTGAACGALALPARAADLQLEACLIRGANDGSETVKYKPADPGLSAKLHRMFRWNHYYEIASKRAGLAVNQSSDLKMSDTCTIRVKNLGGSRVEVHCICHGKALCKGSYALAPPQWLVVGGDDAADTAWFVGLRAVDNKPADPNKAISRN